MKKLHRILLSAAGGAVILILASPGSYPFDNTGNALISAVRILAAVLGALLISYSLHEIHPAFVPLGWASLFLGNLARFLMGNSDGFMEDLAITIMLGIPGMVLLLVGIRNLMRARK